MARWLIGLLPLVWLGFGVWQNTLGANPVERMIRYSGDWGLWWLLATLAIAPLRRLPGCAGLIRLRRLFGLLGFGYAALHVVFFITFEHFFSWSALFRDILKRPFITIGLLAFLLLLPLAVTSTPSWMRRLGPQWGRLHRLVYPASVLVVLHYFLMVKADYRLPILHAVILGGLLGWRGVR
ncbi:MAG: sulfoxide reductase heme-binding subunit YedZ [Magnetococcales bacterium]|nr:sulfoxide reductase heme-binding subunit YedZ [Magnetococcales bacterium]